MAVEIERGRLFVMFRLGAPMRYTGMMDEIIKLIAKYGLIVPVLLALYVFVRLGNSRKRLEFAVLLIGGGILSLLLAKVSGHLISDPRPFVVGHFTPLLPHANDNGFPSDHTLLASFLGYVTLRYSRWVGVAALVAAACIGLARVAAGVHHLEDIIGSFVITGVSTLVVLLLVKLATRRKMTDQEASRS